jgi:predicted DNA-binding protein
MPREKEFPLPNKPLVVRMNQVTLDWLSQQSVEQDRAKCYIVARIVEKHVADLKAKEAEEATQKGGGHA